MEESKATGGVGSEHRKLLALILIAIVSYLWLNRYEFFVVPPGGKGEYGVLVRVHKYSGTAEFTFPLSREWKVVVDDTGRRP
jgi:hypothetical protein